MTIKSLLLSTIPLVFASSVLASESTPVCESENLKVFTDFQGGNIAACDFSKRGALRVQIEPENTPINSSPWYAFRVQASEKSDVRVVLNYGEFKHRYTPDISFDGVKWRTYPADKVKVFDNKSSASFLVTVPANRSLVIAAQPLLTTANYVNWLNALSSENELDLRSIGQSVGGRSLWRAATAPKDKACYCWDASTHQKLPALSP